MNRASKAYSLYAPGSLVTSIRAIYSVDPSMRIPEGTVGTVIRRGNEDYENHCQIHFVSVDSAWWVRYDEIEPHILSQ